MIFLTAISDAMKMKRPFGKENEYVYEQSFTLTDARDFTRFRNFLVTFEDKSDAFELDASLPLTIGAFSITDQKQDDGMVRQNLTISRRKAITSDLGASVVLGAAKNAKGELDIRTFTSKKTGNEVTIQRVNLYDLIDGDFRRNDMGIPRGISHEIFVGTQRDVYPLDQFFELDITNFSERARGMLEIGRSRENAERRIPGLNLMVKPQAAKKNEG